MICIFAAQTFPYKASGFGQFELMKDTRVLEMDLVHISEVVAFLWELPGICHDPWPVVISLPQ